VGTFLAAAKNSFQESQLLRMADTEPSDEGIDTQLLAKIAAGDEQAFIELYRRRHEDVYRFAFAMAKSRSFAQDVMQEVFLNVLENASRFDAAKGTVRAWLFGCARYVTLDRLRLERRWTDEMPPDGIAFDSDERLLADQRVERLHAALARLPIEYREALVLCELHELSYAEAAAVLGCPVGTVRSRLHRGRALLTAMLEEGERTVAETAPTVAGSLQAGEVCS
jgi:RNA polymerase sigma-70 factor (ECF subfamily)